MKKYASRIAMIITLVVFFVTVYTVVDAGYGASSVGFGYWVNLNTSGKCRNFVILGTDKDETRTDLILLCQYKEDKSTLNVLQIPRDSKVDNTRADKKINSAYGSKDGITAVKNEVASLTGIYPENYIVLNFKGFRELIDAIGGVEYNVPIDMKYDDPVQGLKINLKKGYQVLDGEKAEMLMRFRKNNDGSGYAEGDIGRLKAQKSFYDAAVNKILSLEGIVNLGSVMEAVGSNLRTDFTLSDLLGHIDDLKKLDGNSINIFMLPGEGKYINQDGVAVSYYIADTEEISKLTKEYF